MSILTLISVPLYSQYLVQTHRLEAANTLTKLAIAMEEYHIEHHTYYGATLAALRFPDKIGKNSYELSIKNITNENFLLLATPLNYQAKKDALCQTLTLHANGKKGVTGTGKVNDCW